MYISLLSIISILLGLFICVSCGLGLFIYWTYTKKGLLSYQVINTTEKIILSDFTKKEKSKSETPDEKTESNSGVEEIQDSKEEKIDNLQKTNFKFKSEK